MPSIKDLEKLNTDLRISVLARIEERDKFQKTLHELQAEHNKLQAAHNDTRAEHRNLQINVNARIEERDLGTREYNKLQKEFDTLQEKHNLAKVDYTALQTKYTNEMSDMTDERDGWKHGHALLKIDCSKVEKKLSAEMRTNRDILHQLKTQKEQISSLNAALEHECLDHERLVNEHQTLTNNFGDLEREHKYVSRRYAVDTEKLLNIANTLADRI